MSSAQQDKLKAEGNALVQKQQFEQAATIYTKALELDSTSEASAAIFSNRSLCYLNTKKYTEALQDAEKAISLRPTWFRGYQRAAAACEKLTNKDQEGLQYLEKCFELDEACKSDAVMKKMKEDFEINIVKQKAPSMTQDELKQVGNTFVKSKEYKKAIEFYTLAIEKDAFCDEAVPILSNRSMAYYKIRKYKEAYEDGGCCCGIKPDWAKGFMRRGVAAEKLEEWQIALESYDEYLKLDPQDEAGVKSSRNAVAKVVADLQKEEAEIQEEREQFAFYLETIAEGDQRVEYSYTVLFTSACRFDVEVMKLALKHPSNIRLDAPTLRRDSEVSCFHPTALAAARRIFESSPESDEISILLALLITVLSDETQIRKTSITRQVEYLNFLLDVAEEQDFSAPNVKMRDFLEKICLADHVSSDRAVIRKELVITLFNRIDIARKVFLGKTASNKEFASDALYYMCFNNKSDRGQLLHDDDVSNDVCSQDLYECICAAVEAGADPNYSYTAARHSTVAGTLTRTLDAAICDLRSVKVVELLLRHGADPNFFSSIDERVCGDFAGASYTIKVTPTSPLLLAFMAYRPDLIRALLRYGAKLPTEKLPDFVLKCFPPSKNPLIKPQFPGSLFPNSLSILGKPRLRQYVTAEYIQLWFEVIAQQNLSFLCPNAHGAYYTPLTVAIAHHLDASLVALIIELKPELLRQLYLPNSQQPLFAMTPLGALLSESIDPRGPNLAYLQSVADVLMNSGIDIEKDVAQCFFESATSDKVDLSLTGVTYVGGTVLQGHGTDKMQALKDFIAGKTSTQTKFKLKKFCVQGCLSPRIFYQKTLYLYR